MKKLLISFIGLVALSSIAHAEIPNYTIIIKEHKFIPEVTEIPAGQKVKLIIDNQDSTPEEFESHSLKREKIINGNSKGVVLVGPLNSGEYEFFGEFNEDSAQGKIVVK